MHMTEPQLLLSSPVGSDCESNLCSHHHFATGPCPDLNSDLWNVREATHSQAGHGAHPSIIQLLNDILCNLYAQSVIQLGAAEAIRTAGHTLVGATVSFERLLDSAGPPGLSIQSCFSQISPRAVITALVRL